MTPLQKILDWFLNLDYDIQNELLSLCDSFHYENEIKNEYDSKTKVDNFISYLNLDSKATSEIVTRTIFTTQLFDFALIGRSTEAGWNKALDNNLDAKNSLAEKGINSSFIDDGLSEWQTRKYLWINLSKSWEEMKTEYLTIEKVKEWYFRSIRNN
jgi:hypothetical protein